MLATAILISVLWERLPPSSKAPLQQLSAFVWLRGALGAAIWGYGSVQLFRLRAVAVWAFGICVLYSLVVLVVYATSGRPVAGTVIGTFIQILILWYAYDLRQDGVLR